MNKALICLTGLATVLLSQPALAVNPNWQGTMSKSASGYQTGYESRYNLDYQENTLRSTPIGTPKPFSQPSTASSPGLLPPPAVEPPLGVTDRAANPEDRSQDNRAVLPPPPALAESSEIPSVTPSTSSSPGMMPSGESADANLPSLQLAQPIPSDIGVEFDLSNSAKPLPPAIQQPPTPLQSNLPEGDLPKSDLPNKTIAPAPAQPDAATAQSRKPEFTLTDLFNGNSDSIVAVIVGNAEGTRRPDGGPNQAFYGHKDPGNGVWNLGTFSYQHGANSPEEADAKQLNRLKHQAQIMQQKAAEKGLRLTLEETLNGIDLANQAPQAVIDAEGYIEWLAQAHAMGKQDADAILWARVQSFIDPQTQQWNAPGLGNTPDRISQDQQRRMEAIANAINTQKYEISPDARLRPQPMGFRMPGFLGMVRQLTQKTADLLGL